jgi:hypothetical protein
MARRRAALAKPTRRSILKRGSATAADLFAESELTSGRGS